MKGPIARGTIRTTWVLGLRLAVQAGTLLVVARMLGPHRFGAFAGVAALAVMLGTLSTFGTHLVLLGEVSKDPARRDRVLPYAVPTTLLCGGGLLAIYLVICALALDEAQISLPVLLAVGATEMLLQPLFGLMTSEHHALGRIARAQLLQLLPLALRLTTAAAVFGLRLPDPLPGYAMGYFAASLVSLAFGATRLPASWPTPLLWRPPRRAELREAFGYAAINITKAGPAELDKTLAVKLLPLGAAGVYAAGARVMGAVTLPITAMTLAALPRLFRAKRESLTSAGKLLHWMFGSAAIYSLLLAGILWLIAPVFEWVFGHRYENIEQLIRWLCIAVPGMSLRLVAGNILMALGIPWMRAAFETFGLVVLVVAAAVLTAKLGSIGMALSLACSEWGMALVGNALLFGSFGRTSTAIRQHQL